MNTSEIERVILNSRPTCEDDYHSERHIEALKKLHDMLHLILTKKRFDRWFEYSEKATAEESADFALKLVHERPEPNSRMYIDQLDSMMKNCEEKGFSEAESVMMFAHGIVAFAQNRADAVEVVLAAWQNVEGDKK